MDHEAEDPRGKSNVFGVPPLVFQDWQKMISLGCYNIKEMFSKDTTSCEDSQSSKQVATMIKGRKRHNRHAKSKATVESDHFDSNDKAHSQKSKGRAGVKSSTKKGLQSSDMEMKTIHKDSTLLMPERVESCQVEFDERHQAKLSGAMDIRQSMVSSHPDVTLNFSATQVPTQWSEHAQNVQGS